MNTTYLFVQIGFVALTIISFLLLFRILRSALAGTALSQTRQNTTFNRSILAFLAWTAFVSILSLAGTLSDFSGMPPRLFMVLIVPVIMIIVVMNAKATSEILQQIQPRALISLQVFRVFVEILLWGLFTQNLLPVQMTFEGRNFDILVGLTAPFVAWLYQHQKISRTLVIIWNFAGLLLLLNIVTIAILSMPTPMRVFLNDPANTIVAEFPIVWLPGLLVPLAYWLHLLSLKQLLGRTG